MNIISGFNSRSTIHKIASVLGFIASCIGMAVWWVTTYSNSLIPFQTDLNPMVFVNRFYNIMFLFLPACLALVASVFNKNYMMYLALLICIPIGDFISYDMKIFRFIQLTILLYIVSAILMTIRRSEKKEQDFVENIHN